MAPQRIAVIGGVASGPAAAAEAKRVDPEADVVLLEQGNAISYGSCEIPYYVADVIKDVDGLISLTPSAFAESRHVRVLLKHQVESIHPAQGRLAAVDLESGRNVDVRYDKLILATGAKAIVPDLSGSDARNVFSVRFIDDAVRLKSHLSRHEVRHAVVVGGGYIGLEMAEALSQRGLRVSVLEARSHVLPGYLDPEMSALVATALTEHRVAVRHERMEALRVDGDGNVRAIETDHGEHIGCDLVVLALGAKPNVCLAEPAGIRLGVTGAIEVDDSMRTNVPNVWACGDVVQLRRVVDGRPTHAPLSPTGFRTARVAARNAARRGRGSPARFPGVCPASAVKAFGLEIATAGLTLTEAINLGMDATAVDIRHRSRVGIFPEAKPVHVRLVAERKTRRLLGGQLVGEDGAALRTNVLVPVLHAGWSVDRLAELDLIYTPPLAPSLDPLFVAARAAIRELS